MQENFSPMVSRDPYGFETVPVRISARLSTGSVASDIDVRVVKSLYDQYKEMGEEVLNEYLRNLFIEHLVSSMSITHAVSDSPW